MNDSHKTLGETEPTYPSPDSVSAPMADPADPEVLTLHEVHAVRVLPSEFFFVERVEIPTALETSELDDFAELSMEGLAPFPLEQLYWGFLHDPQNQTLVLYAALRDRLKRAGYEALEDHTWVLPDFACLLGARFAEPVHLLLHTPGHTTHLQFTEGQELPHIIDASRADTTGPDHLGEDPHTHLELRLIQPAIDEKARPTFRFETVGSTPVQGHWSPLSPDEASLWRADIRPAAFKAAERSARRTSAVISRCLRYAAVFACLLATFEGLLYAGKIWLGTQERKIESQTTSVRRVEDKQSLTNKLEQVAQNELRPIAILEAANQIRLNLGNTGIVYDETIIEGSNRITIEGTAGTINELNAYTDSLNKSGAFTLVGSPRQRTRGGETTFTVTLDYQHPKPGEEPDPKADPEITIEATAQAEATR